MVCLFASIIIATFLAIPSLDSYPQSCITSKIQTENRKPFRGIDYSPYTDELNPATGMAPSEEDIRHDMSLLQFLTDRIRIYSSTGIFEKIPAIAKEYGLLVIPTAWLGKNDTRNNEEIQSVIDLVRKYDNIPFVVVGNEAIRRDDLTEDQLISFTMEVKKSVDIPVTTSEDRKIIRDNPEIAESIDFIFLNIHPYNDGKLIDIATEWIEFGYKELCAKYPNKEIIIGETGWPTDGEKRGSAIPSLQNQQTFISDFMNFSKTYDVDYFFFQAFDQKIKAAAEGEAGAHWGLFYSNRIPKEGISAYLGM